MFVTDVRNRCSQSQLVLMPDFAFDSSTQLRDDAALVGGEPGEIRIDFRSWELLMKSRKRLWLVAGALLGCLATVVAAAKGGSFLVVDVPRPSDVIVVLAGETDRRPERGLQLLAQG